MYRVGRALKPDPEGRPHVGLLWYDRSRRLGLYLLRHGLKVTTHEDHIKTLSKFPLNDS